jgi:hypothetical protein
MNGTGAEALRDGYANAAAKVSDAIQALYDVEFNQRDYYPQGAAAWEQAKEDYRTRYTALVQVRDDLAAVAEHCQKVIDERLARLDAVRRGT